MKTEISSAKDALGKELKLDQLIKEDADWSSATKRALTVAFASERPSSFRYANADLSKFFDGDKRWQKNRLTLYISRQGTVAEWVLGQGEAPELMVECFWADTFLKARNAFADHLESYSSLVDKTFRAPEPCYQYGQLNLVASDTADSSSEPVSIILWVYSNIFVRIASMLSDQVDNTSSVRDLAQKLNRYIRDSAVESQLQADVPKVHDIAVPQQITVGRKFDIVVSLKADCYGEAYCDAGVRYDVLEKS
ncbi:hypothetical protein N7467_011918 [Penicillium canescens]|nr:hypothetical protein N7467_011918 [Penicillium canescens]